MPLAEPRSVRLPRVTRRQRPREAVDQPAVALVQVLRVREAAGRLQRDESVDQGPQAADRVDGVIAGESVAAQHGRDGLHDRIGDLLILGVPWRRRDDARFVAAGVLLGESPVGVRHGPESVRARFAHGCRGQFLMQFAAGQHRDVPAQLGEAGHVLVQTRLTDPEPGRDGRESELIPTIWRRQARRRRRRSRHASGPP